MTSGRPRELRLVAYVAAGALLGALYVAFDAVSESRIEHGTLTGALASVHAAIDRTFPILAGALLGVCAHYLQLRARLARVEEAAARAEALRTRLLKVERDQAVWVLVATVLHELNNPLHALGLLVDELDEAEDEAARSELVARARVQTERVREQLQILRSMRGLGEPELEPIALDRVVGALVADAAALAEEAGLSVELECERPVTAAADPTYLRAIIENLLDNSLHALRGAGRGAIRIRLGVEADRAVVRVGDDGPALDAAIKERLFEPLRSTKTQGLGLGLPIARALARAMRGDLALDEVEPKTFRLELPLGGAP